MIKNETPRILAPLSTPLNEKIKLDRDIPVDCVFLFIGFLAWSRGHERAETFPASTIVIPAWYPPDMYSFPVERCRVLIVETHQETSIGFSYVYEIALELKRQGAELVFYLDHENPNEPDLLTL